MTFANPHILYFLVIVPLLAVVFYMAEKSRAAQVNAMSVPSRPGMVMGAGFERRLVYLILLCLGVSFLTLAAARPQWGARMEELQSKGIDILVAVDVSESMNAQDVAPSRMAKARQEIHQFLDLLEGDRVGLIGFAGSAYTFVPLTVDYGAIRMFLDTMEPGVIEYPGTDLGAALETAVDTFERSEVDAGRVLVIFSDGEHHEKNPIPLAQKAAEAGIQVFTIGVGNIAKSGERIPTGKKDGVMTYKVDQEQNLVITKLDEATLTRVAEVGGGDYYRVSQQGDELASIYRRLQDEQEAEFNSRAFRMKEDRYQIPLAIGLLLITIAYSLGSRSMKKLRRTQGVRG